MTCPKCPESPWAVPQGAKPETTVKKVCCDRTSTWGEVRK